MVGCLILAPGLTVVRCEQSASRDGGGNFPWVRKSDRNGQQTRFLVRQHWVGLLDQILHVAMSVLPDDSEWSGGALHAELEVLIFLVSK